MTIRISYLILFILGSLMPNALSALVTKAGTIDSSFSVPCFSKSVPFVKAFVIQSDGKIVSDIGTYNSNNCAQTIGRFNSNGTLDNSFLSPFSISDDAVLAIANQSDGKIIVGGKFGSGNSRFSVARLNTNGTFDSSF
ncbi:MAG: delta-60 repeat domain-containing protein, partial [Verrucomicrobiota bacterium]